MLASTGANMYSAQNPPDKSSPHVVETDRKNRFTANRSPSPSSQDSTVEKFASKYRTASNAPPPRSYHLHGGTFLDFATVSTRVLHPYRIHLFRSSQTENRSSTRDPAHAHTGTYRPLTTTGITPSVDESLSVPASDAPFGASSAAEYAFLLPVRKTSRLPSPVAADRDPRSGGRDRQEHYQLAFLTPGIRPFDAISRNWIRLMPNWRM